MRQTKRVTAEIKKKGQTTFEQRQDKQANIWLVQWKPAFCSAAVEQTPYSSSCHLFVPGLVDGIQHRDERCRGQDPTLELPPWPHSTLAVDSALAFDSLLAVYEWNIPPHVSDRLTLVSRKRNPVEIVTAVAIS